MKTCVSRTTDLRDDFVRIKTILVKQEPNLRGVCDIFVFDHMQPNVVDQQLLCSIL